MRHKFGACRERKKAKAAELQAAVQALSERMQELTVAQRRNAELRARNAELQQVTHTCHFSASCMTVIHQYVLHVAAVSDLEFR